MTKFKVWIDPDLCTGDGICAEIEPKIFYMADDGLAYVKAVDEKENPSKPPRVGAKGIVDFPDEIINSVVEAAEECPGECIFIEKSNG